MENQNLILALYGVTVASRVSALTVLAAFLILLATLCLYQPSINYSLMLIFIIFILTCDNTDALKLLILRLSILFIALVAYKTLIIPLSGMDSLSMQRGEIISFDTTGMLKLYNNIGEALNNINTAFPGLIKYPLAFVFMTGISACAFCFWQQMQKRKYIISGLVILSPFLIMLCVPGFLLVLKNARFDPRVLGAFSTAVIFFFCISYHAFVFLRKTLVACLIIYILFSAVFMTTLFRVAVNQERFNEDVIVSIRNMLSLFPSNSVTGVSFIGASPYSPDVLPSLRRYPYMRYYFTSAFTENNEFRYYGPARRVMFYFPLNQTTQAMKDYIPVKKISSGCVFHLYTYGKTAVINFSMPACHIPQQYMHLPPRVM
ncbi:glucosyltransferase domain-containing protein [Enterobacter cloacae]